MKIVFISNNFPPVVDGVGDYTYHLSTQFAERGVETYIICSKKKEIIEYWQNKPSSLHIIPLVDSWNLRCLSTILKEIRQINPDWVSLQYVPYSFHHYGIPFSIAYLLVILKLKKYKTLVTFHEVAIRLYLNKLKYVPIAIMQRIIAFCMALVSRKIITSIDLYMNMLGCFSKKTIKIPIGSNILPVELDGTIISLLASRIAPDKEFILCSFGSNLRKNDFLLDIVSDLSANLYNLKLIFLGKLPAEGSKTIRERAAQLNISDKIIIPGYLSSEDIFLHLKCSDLFLQIEEITGKNQGGVSTKSGAIAAAYAAGLPIIGTWGDMTDDFFKNHENIVFVGAHDKEGIKSNIIRFINNKSELLKIRENSLYTYKTYLQWPVLANQYEQVLDMVN